MTNAERLVLADIERRLVLESPELDRLLAGRPRDPGRRRRNWWVAGLVAALLSVALVITGMVWSAPVVAVAAVCPPLGVLTCLGADRFLLARSRPLRWWRRRPGC